VQRGAVSHQTSRKNRTASGWKRDGLSKQKNEQIYLHITAKKEKNPNDLGFCCFLPFELSPASSTPRPLPTPSHPSHLAGLDPTRRGGGGPRRRRPRRRAQRPSPGAPSAPRAAVAAAAASSALAAAAAVEP
jgi:hypothetical protein